MNTTRKFLAVLVIILIPVIYFLYMSQEDILIVPPSILDEGPVVHIGNVPVRVEVADTPELQQKGLSGRDSLEPTAGMLFIFDKSGYHQIWMKDMRIVIDVIWIDEQFTVVDITENLRPETFPLTFEPRTPARYVLETNGNYAESFGVQIGDIVTIPKDLLPEDMRT